MKARLLLILAATLSLGGCALLGLGGGGKKAQMYRFGPGEATATVPARTVTLQSLTFEPAAEGDRLLTITGSEAAYISNTRWVAPARDLFTQAAERAFDRAGVRLARRNQAIDSGASLVLEVPAFETRYEAGAQAAPVVVVEVRATLVTGGGKEVLGETAFAVRQPAAANRVGEIVAAYDAATRSALDQTAAWAAGRAPAAAARS